ncbi:MAG: helix-turn-helix domain-containing protein [Waddliaceae bacterium]
MTKQSDDNKQFLSTAEAAKLLDVSRVTVFNRIKRGDIAAHKVGREYAIPREEVTRLVDGEITDEDKQVIDAAVDKTFSEYGEALRKLGKE